MLSACSLAHGLAVVHGFLVTLAPFATLAMHLFSLFSRQGKPQSTLLPTPTIHLDLHLKLWHQSDRHIFSKLDIALCLAPSSKRSSHINIVFSTPTSRNPPRKHLVYISKLPRHRPPSHHVLFFLLSPSATSIQILQEKYLHLHINLHPSIHSPPTKTKKKLKWLFFISFGVYLSTNTINHT